MVMAGEKGGGVIPQFSAALRISSLDVNTDNSLAQPGRDTVPELIKGLPLWRGERTRL